MEVKSSIKCLDVLGCHKNDAVEASAFKKNNGICRFATNAYEVKLDCVQRGARKIIPVMQCITFIKQQHETHSQNGTPENPADTDRDSKVLLLQALKPFHGLCSHCLPICEGAQETADKDLQGFSRDMILSRWAMCDRSIIHDIFFTHSILQLLCSTWVVIT